MSDRVLIFDTTLRDGEQSPGASMNQEEKLSIARLLQELKVDIIEAGFPIASKGDFNSVQAIAREIKDCQVAGLARAKHEDIETAWNAVKDGKTLEYIPLLQLALFTCNINLNLLRNRF